MLFSQPCYNCVKMVNVCGLYNCLWLFLFCSTFLCACELLPVSEKVQNRAKRNMYNHYLDDANYNWCIGVVKEKRGDLLSIQFGDAIDELNWSGLFWDYSSEGEDLSSYFHRRYQALSLQPWRAYSKLFFVQCLPSFVWSL